MSITRTFIVGIIGAILFGTFGCQGPTQPGRAVPIPASCECADRDDIRIRLKAAEASVERARRLEEQILQENPNLKFTKTLKETYFDSAIIRVQADAATSTGLHYRSTGFTGASTDPISCHPTYKVTTSCMSADAQVHEAVHVEACQIRKHSLNPFHDPTSDQPFLEFIREDEKAYGAEVVFLQMKLKQLSRVCDEYKFGPVSLKTRIISLWSLPFVDEFTIREGRVCHVGDYQQSVFIEDNKSSIIADGCNLNGSCEDMASYPMRMTNDGSAIELSSGRLWWQMSPPGSMIISSGPVEAPLSKTSDCKEFLKSHGFDAFINQPPTRSELPQGPMSLPVLPPAPPFK